MFFFHKTKVQMGCSSISKVKVVKVATIWVAVRYLRWVLLISHSHRSYPLCHSHNHSIIQRRALAQITMLRHHSTTIFRHIQLWIRKKRIWTRNFYRYVTVQYTRTKRFCSYFTPLIQIYVCMIQKLILNDFVPFFCMCVSFFPFGLECFVVGIIFLGGEY